MQERPHWLSRNPDKAFGEKLFLFFILFFAFAETRLYITDEAEANVWYVDLAPCCASGRSATRSTSW